MDNQNARDRADALLRAWNGRDYGEVASHLTPDVVIVDHTRHRTSSGADGYVDRYRRLLEAFPDMRGETTSMLAEGNLLVHETTWKGRHTVSLKLPGHESIAPTNDLMTIHLVTFMEFNDEGQIRGVRVYGDLAGVPSARAVGVG
jgi:predicted ester cyclase